MLTMFSFFQCAERQEIILNWYLFGNGIISIIFLTSVRSVIARLAVHINYP